MTPIPFDPRGREAVMHRRLSLSTAKIRDVDRLHYCVLMTPPDPALVLQGLVKRFDGVYAVAGLDLEVPTGSFYGLLGPNGAGKTTTLNMAVGLLRPDHGRAIVLGRDVWRDPIEAKRALGTLPDGVRLFDRLTGAELLEYTGLLRGMDRATIADRSR